MQFVKSRKAYKGSVCQIY